MNLKDELLALNDCGGEEITVAKWGRKFWIRELNGLERSELFEKSMTKDKLDGKKLLTNAVIVCLCDPETKEPVFSVADFDAVSKKNGAALEQIQSVAFRINGIGDTAVSDAEKN